MKRAFNQCGGGGGGVGGGEVLTLPFGGSAGSLKRVCGASGWSFQMSRQAPFQPDADEAMDEDAVDDEHFSEHYHAHKAWWHAQACGQCSQCSSCMLSAAV